MYKIQPCPPQVLIVGAGIAGPALAFWLARIGCDTTIIERDAALRDSGQQIDLRGQGILLMRRMRLEGVVRAVLCDEPGTQLVDATGRQKTYFALAGPMLPETECGIWILHTVAWVVSVMRLDKLFGWFKAGEGEELMFPDHPALARQKHGSTAVKGQHACHE